MWLWYPKKIICHFQSVPRYRKRTDQKPPIIRHFWLPTPLCHTYSEPSGHEDSLGPCVTGAKIHPEIPRNKYFPSFGQLWVIQSPPTMTIPVRSLVFAFCPILQRTLMLNSLWSLSLGKIPLLWAFFKLLWDITRSFARRAIMNN